MEEIADRRQGWLESYSAKLARDHPLVWATRIDIAMLFLLIAGVCFPLIMSLWTPNIDSPSSAYSRRSAYESKVWAGYLSFGGLAMLAGAYWIMSMLSSLQLAHAPRLRWLPWSMASHLAVLLFLLPALFAFVYGVNEYFFETAKSTETSNYNLNGGLFSILAGFGLTSFLAAFAVTARRFDVQEAMIGALVAIVQLIGWVVLVGVTLNSGDAFQHAGRTFLAIVLCSYCVMALVRGARMGSRQRLMLFYPALFGVTAGPLFFLGVLGEGAGPSLCRTSSTTCLQVSGGIAFGALGYAVAAILTQLLVRRTSAAGRRG